jgi:RimJ/RimL family protein N-acetyltransferase
MIATNRLKILPFSLVHLNQRYVDWLNDANLMRFSEQRHRQHSIQECRNYWKSFEGTKNLFLAIEIESEPSRHIGNISIHFDENNSIADIAILIGDADSRGSRYGSEAWGAVCEFLFATYGARKITAGTLSTNLAMLKIMERAGMIPDGVRKRHFVVNGKEVDIIYKALFKTL